MNMTEAIQELGFDCKIRKLSPKTISNYQKQLKYLQRYLDSEFRVSDVEAVKSISIKQFLALKADQGRKARYDKPFANFVFSMIGIYPPFLDWKLSRKEGFCLHGIIRCNR